MRLINLLFRKNNIKDIDGNSIDNKESGNNYNAELNSVFDDSVNSITVDIKNKEEKDFYIELFAKGSDPCLKFNDRDPMFVESARLIVQNQHGSTSLIQRKFKLSYNRAGLIMEQLEELKIVGPFEGDKARQVLFVDEVSLEKYLNGLELLSNDLFYEENKIEIERRKAEYESTRRDELDQQEKVIIKQRILDKERRKRIKKEALKELLNERKIEVDVLNNAGKREAISQDVMDKVWNRDGGHCVQCGSRENLEFDHIIPFSKGGASTYRNIQLICEKCNIEKSNKIG